MVRMRVRVGRTHLCVGCPGAVYDVESLWTRKGDVIGPDTHDRSILLMGGDVAFRHVSMVDSIELPQVGEARNKGARNP